MQEFQKAQRARLPSTGEYLLEDLTYQNWKRRKPSLHVDRSGKGGLDPTQALILKGKHDTIGKSLS
jgi:hypothetical protein